MKRSAYSMEALTRRRPLNGSSSSSFLHQVGEYENSASSSSSPHSGGATTKYNSSNDNNYGGGSGSNSNNNKLQRTLTLPDIIFYGVGCSVGAGVYSLVGIGAKLAGPSIALSFLLCGIACCFTSLAYAEFASRVPLAGSAYTFTYVTFGELCGWLVGWNLTLGYGVSASVVARSWAEYLVGFVSGILGTTVVGSNNDNNNEDNNNNALQWLTHAPLPWLGQDYTCCPLSMVIIGLCTVVLVTGAKESTRFNTAMTLLNLTVLGFVLFAGVGSGTVNSDNLVPVFPHGLLGMARGAGLVFFSYLGFDMVACLSEEVVHPERNMPIGIIGSLLVSMSIYVSVSIVVVGMAPVSLLGEDVPILNALLANACCTHSDQLEVDATDTCLSYTCQPILHPILFYGSRVISFGAIFGLTTATFACLMGQPRIFYSMAQDGLLFKIYAIVDRSTGVPTLGTILTGIFTAAIACLVDLESLANVISLETLQVFTFVNAGVIILRMRPPLADAAAARSPSLDDADLHDDERAQQSSPLVKDPNSDSIARHLGIVKRTSSQILRTSSVRGVGRTSFDDENGTRPIWLVLVFTICAIIASVSFSHGWPMWIVLGCVIPGFVCSCLLWRLPAIPPPDTFACPLVPLVPLLGIVCNSYMMGSMPLSTWSVILVWLLAGLLFYFGYGIHHSELRTSRHGVAEMAHLSSSAELLSERTTTTEYDSISPY